VVGRRPETQFLLLGSGMRCSLEVLHPDELEQATYY
jgi:hypothetical protein